jgi:hypothetical protein
MVEPAGKESLRFVEESSQGYRIEEEMKSAEGESNES